MKIGSFSSSSSYISFRSLKTAQKEITQTLGRLSSGTRPVVDGPVAALLAEGLKAQANGFEVANQNLNQSYSVLQTADGALSSQTEDLLRMREIAVQAANGTLGNTERGFLETEFNSLRESVDFTSRSTSFNGQKLLDGTFSASIQAGATSSDQINVDLPNTGANALGLNGLNFDTEDDASDAIAAIDLALNEVTSARADPVSYTHLTLPTNREV